MAIEREGKDIFGRPQDGSPAQGVGGTPQLDRVLHDGGRASRSQEPFSRPEQQQSPFALPGADAGGAIGDLPPAVTAGADVLAEQSGRTESTEVDKRTSQAAVSGDQRRARTEQAVTEIGRDFFAGVAEKMALFERGGTPVIDKPKENKGDTIAYNRLKAGKVRQKGTSVVLSQSEKARLQDVLDRMPSEYDRKENRAVRNVLIASGQVVGGGAENLIVEAEDNPDKLYGITIDSELSQLRAKDIYWGHKILNTLFPHNFPKIRAVYWDENTNGQPRPRHTRYHPQTLTGTVRERIQPLPDRQQSLYSFEAVLHFCAALGISSGAIFDPAPQNVISGEDGGRYYVDIVNSQAYQEFRKINPESITGWMDSHTVMDKQTDAERPYTDLEKQNVLKALERMKTDYPTSSRG